MAANPFYVDPMADYSRGLAGLTQSVKQVGEKKRADEIKEKSEARYNSAKNAFQEAAKSGDPEKIADVTLEYPELSKAFLVSQGIRDKGRADEASSFMTTILTASEEDRPALYKERIQSLKKAGKPTEQSAESYMRYSSNPQTEINRMELVLASTDGKAHKALVEQRRAASGELTGASTKAFAPVTIVNPETKEKRLVTPTFNPKTNKAELSAFDMPEGFQISKETAAEERAAEVVQTGKKETVKVGAKSIAQRNQGYIDSGVEAADSMSGIGDAIALLDLVKTGGYEAAALRAKQTLGIESADEGELANALGLAVLSQLKPIFGSAFTSEEGARLERLSAGFGKSPEANKRILKKQLKIAERSARRAIKAAQESGDTFTENEIKHGLYSAKGGELMEDADGNKAYKMPDGSYKEVN
jgi:hypothetical protein